MYFRFQGKVRELFLTKGSVTVFNYTIDGVPVTLTLGAPTNGEKEKTEPTTDAPYLLELLLEPPPEIRQLFDSLAAGRMPPGSKDGSRGIRAKFGSTTRFFPGVGSDGSITPGSVPPIDLMPDQYHDFLRQEIRTPLRRALVTVEVLRWRIAEPGPHNSTVGGEGEYSFDTGQWFPMPSGLYMESSSRSSTRVSEKIRAEIELFVTQGGLEPLGHELYREAWDNRGENNRSALILGVAAAEAAVKQCISALVPDAAWLVETGPSPSLGDMIKNYLPTLPAKIRINDQVPQLPKPVRSVLDGAVKQRNKLVHVGKGEPTSAEVLKILLAVWDVLWLCDAYLGHEWALEYLSPETRRSLGLAEADDRRWISIED